MPDPKSLRRSTTGPGVLLTAVRELGLCSRADLVTYTGLARATVEDRLTRLLNARYIVTSQSATSTGRPAQKFRFNDGSGVLLVADVGSTHTRVGVANLNCELLSTREVSLNLDAGASTIFAAVVEKFEAMLLELNLDHSRVRGFGGGSPGAIDAAGTSFMSKPDWCEEDLLDLLRMAFKVRGFAQFPIELDRDVNIMTLGEMRTSFPHISDMLVIKVGMAVSCGIAANGALLRGALGFAGDIAHRPLAAEDFPQMDLNCRCGQDRCSEPLMSGAGIAAQLANFGHDCRTSRDIRSLVETGNPEALQLLEQAAQRLGLVISGAVRTLNPELIVIGGNLAERNQLMIEQVRSAILHNSHPMVTTGLSIVGSSITVDAGMLGAAHLIRDALLDESAVQARLAAGLTW